MSEIKDGGHFSGSRNKITFISASIHDSNKISTAIPILSRSGNTKRLVGILSDVRINRRWRPVPGSRNEITYVSASIHDSNEISTAIPMFLGSGNTKRLVGRLSSGKTVRRLSKSEIKDGGH